MMLAAPLGDAGDGGGDRQGDAGGEQGGGCDQGVPPSQQRARPFACQHQALVGGAGVQDDEHAGQGGQGDDGYRGHERGVDAGAEGQVDHLVTWRPFSSGC